MAQRTGSRNPSPGVHPRVTAESVGSARAAIATVLDRGAAAGLTDQERIDLLNALEELKATASAAQALVTCDFVRSQRDAQAAAGVPSERRSRGIASQVALARKTSPFHGSRLVGVAQGLVEMPHALAGLNAGILTERRATLLVRETAVLSLEDRQRVDRELCADPRRLHGLGDRKIADEARRLAYQLDPYAVTRAAAKAAADRHVSIRPEPDTMVRLSALLPVAQGVAAYAALKAAADTGVSAGDPRGRGQLMADTLVERITGQSTADAVPVGVQLVMTPQTLFGPDGSAAANTPAHLPGYGHVPGEVARELVRTALERLGPRAAGWIKRLFAHPETGELVAMDSRARRFRGGMEAFIAARDAGICRTPWCDAPIAETDHVVGVAEHGTTERVNGQGACRQCNHAKQAPGWRARPVAGPRHPVETTTPTGHRYLSNAPPLPGAPPPADLSWGESKLALLLATA